MGTKKTGKIVVLLLLAALLAISIYFGLERFGGGAAEAVVGEQAGGSAGGTEQGPGQGNPEQETVFAVSTIQAVQGQIKNYIDVNGDVVTKTRVDTYPDTAGKLSRLYVDVGDRVRKDQVIAEVDPSRPGMQFSASPVKAPISGMITSLPVQVGSTVSQQMTVAQVSKMDDLELRVHVAERFISKMQVGLPAEIRFEAYPSREFTGRVREISPVVDPVSRTLELKISISDGADVLKAGMFGEVKIITEEKSKVVKIPSDSLVRRFGDDFVFVVNRDAAGADDAASAGTEGTDADDAGAAGTKAGADADNGDILGLAERRRVSAGIEIDQKLEVQSGLEPGEEVVYRGQSLLEDGSKVRVVEQVQPLSESDALD
jgi:membrane fusion protein, multidrug efflux system